MDAEEAAENARKYVAEVHCFSWGSTRMIYCITLVGLSQRPGDLSTAISKHIRTQHSEARFHLQQAKTSNIDIEAKTKPLPCSQSIAHHRPGKTTYTYTHIGNNPCKKSKVVAITGTQSCGGGTVLG